MLGSAWLINNDRRAGTQFFLATQCLTQLWVDRHGDRDHRIPSSTLGERIYASPSPHQFGSGGVASLLVVGQCASEQRTIHVADLGDPHLRLLRPLPVCLHTSGEVATAFSYDLDEAGIGETESEALDDFRAGVVDAYRLLKAEKDNLGPLQQRHWNFLSDIVEEV